MESQRRLSIHEEGLLWQKKIQAEETALEATLRRAHSSVIIPQLIPGLSPIPELPRPNRGVYVLPFLSRRGRYVLVAVDRKGLYVARTIVPDIDHFREAESATWGILDELDPIPKLVR